MSSFRISTWAVAVACAFVVTFGVTACPLAAGQAHADGGQLGASPAQVQPAKAKAKKAAKYKVKFKANGGEGKMSSQTFRFGQKKALAANRFKRAGYKFVGWNTKKDGTGKSYRNKKKVRNLVKSGKKKAVLYAQWKMPLGNVVKIYSPVLKSLEEKHYWFGYKYVDVMGDKTAELVAWSYPPNTGMPRHDYIYTIESGTAKLVLDNTFYALGNESVTYNKAAKSLVYYKQSPSSRYLGRSGVEYYSYSYFKYSGGKFKLVAEQCYSRYSGKWSYWVPRGTSNEFIPFTNVKGTSISEATFNKKVRKLTSGDDAAMIDLSWESMAQIKNEANRYTGL